MNHSLRTPKELNALVNQSASAATGTADTLPDGSLIVSPEQLARLGNGDARRGRRELRLLLAAEREHAVHNGPTERPATVRVPTPKDEKAIFDLLMADLAENGAARIAVVNDDKVAELIMACTRGRGGIAGVIDGPDGTPVAVCALLPHAWWWSKQFYFQDVVCYVHPDHRRSHHIDDLLNFERWAADQMSKNSGHRVWLMTGVLGTKRVREKLVLWRRKFAQAGAAFLYPSPFDEMGT